MIGYMNTFDLKEINTTDNYVVVDKWNKSYLLTTTMEIKNTGANGASVKVMGSIDGGVNYDIEVVSETTIATNNHLVVKITDYYTHLQIEAKSQVAGSATKVATKGCAIQA